MRRFLRSKLALFRSAIVGRDCSARPVMLIDCAAGFVGVAGLVVLVGRRCRVVCAVGLAPGSRVVAAVVVAVLSVVSVVSPPKISKTFLDMKLPSVALVGMGLVVVFKLGKHPIAICPP